jgi:hypothetical protein
MGMYLDLAMVPMYLTEALVLSLGANMIFNIIGNHAMKSAERSQHQALCQYFPQGVM